MVARANPKPRCYDGIQAERGTGMTVALRRQFCSEQLS